MIRDLDATIKAVLQAGAIPTDTLATAAITFDLPDSTWRQHLSGLTINCYLYDVVQNMEMRTEEPLLVRTGNTVARVTPPARVDCSYCITAWSIAHTDAVLDEHHLLSQVLMVLLQQPTIPAALLQGTLVGQIPPYPTIVATTDGVIKNHPQFWTALNQELKPSLNYVVTLAMLYQGVPAGVRVPNQHVNIATGQIAPAQVGLPPAPVPPSGTVFTLEEK